MPSYPYPGVYVENVPPLSRPIAGVSTSTAGFIGVATATTTMPKKPDQSSYTIQPTLTPKLVTSWEEFRQSFGDVSAGNKYLALAVYSFFNNGGTLCYVARVTKVDVSEFTACLAEFAKIDEISIVAAPLPPENEEVPAADLQAQNHAAMTGALNAALASAKEALTRATKERTSAARNLKDAQFEVDTVQALADQLKTKPDADKQKLVDAELPKRQRLLTEATTANTSAGNLEEAAGKTVVGAQAAVDAFAKAAKPVNSNANVNPSIWPMPAIYAAMISHCESLKDRVAILDSRRDESPDTVSSSIPASKDGFAALYYPWIQVSDPTAIMPNGKIFIPPSGAIAGIYARTDSERGVHKAPANQTVRGALGLRYQVTKERQGMLNETGINCTRNFYGSIMVWGGRTLASNAGNTEFKYVNVRRFMIFLEESIQKNLSWAVFEPNDSGLWQRITRTVSDFLLTQWRAGALFGETPKQAFFVRCDATTNSSDVRELGQVVTEIGVAVVKPAEFVIFRVQQGTGG